MRFQGQFLRLFSFMYFVCLLRAKKLCDVRVWYLNLINDDVFDVDLTGDQLNLKTTIESLVMKASESRDTRMLECSTLYLYNDMLKDLFNYTPSGFGMDLKEVESDDILERTDSVTSGIDNTVILTDDQGLSNKQTKEETDNLSKYKNMDETEINLDIDESDTKTDEIEGNVDIENEGVETLAREPGTYESAASVSSYNQDHLQTDDTDHLSNERVTLDETEYPDVTELGSSASDEIVETNQNYRHVLQIDEEGGSDVYANIAGTLKKRTILFGTCYSFKCLISDIFYVHTSDGVNNGLDIVKFKTNSIPTLLKSKFELKCPFRTFCTSQCFYKFLLSKSFCMIGFINNTFIPSDNNAQKIDNNNKDNSQAVKGSMEDILENVSLKDLNAETEKPTPVPQIIKGSKMSSGIQGEDGNNLDEKSFSAEAKVNKKLSLTEFESIVEQKTRKYNKKIQHLEVMILKLENQLLMSALNKQNHSSTITKLENQILSFENELLRMNKNYQNIRAETESTSKRQHKYLELAYRQLNKEYPKLPDKSSQKYELVAQQQIKINELGELLRNQSSVIMQLKMKHDHLEKQNKMLREMVMNKTIVMNSIVKTVQDLSEQNIKNRNEISALRQKVAQNSVVVANSKEINVKPKDNKDVIDKLDTLLFDNFLEKSSLIKKDEMGSKSKLTENSDRLKMYIRNAKKIEKSIVTNWCPRDNKTCPSCYYSPYVNLNCVPFSSVIWTEFEKTRAEEQSVEESDYPAVPDVIDAITTTENMIVQTEDKIVQNDNNLGEDNEAEKSEDAIEEVNVSFNKEKPKDAKDSKDFSMYALVGYDRDGKPVLKVRENFESEEATSEYMLDDKKVKTVTKPSSIQNVEELTWKKYETENKEMTEKNINFENDGKNEQDNAETLDINKPVANEVKRSMFKELKDSDSPHDTKIGDNKDSIKANDNLESSKVNNVDISDDTKKVSTISYQVKDIESRNESSVDKANQENERSVSKTDHEQNKQATNHYHVEDMSKENSKKIREQQDIKDTKNVEINVKEGDHKKIKQSENKPKERKSPIHIGQAKQNEPKDCYDIYTKGEKRDGLYKVNPLGSDKQIQVFCDMRRGGWTVIQRRQDGSTNFFQEWDDYKKGFGGLYGEHWLGNDNIHYLTNQDFYKLRVELMDWEKNKKFAEFDYFLVDGEEESYKIHIDGYNGDAGDGLTKHDGSKFSTKDVDNDKVVKEFGGSCAKRFYGAGWYYKCYASNLNGKFYKGGKIPEKRFDGITWKPWTGPNYSLKKVEMKIRPASAKN